MNIGDLKPGMRGVSIEGTIDSLTEPRTVNLRAGGTAQVADAIISDETGTIKLSLWDDQINMVKQATGSLLKMDILRRFEERIA